MPDFLHQTAPFIVPVQDGKYIAEHYGFVATEDSRFSFAHMIAPPAWSEPPQTPEFDELTFVFQGKKQINVNGQVFVVHAGESFFVKAGQTVQYSNPFSEPAHYVSVCIPAFTLKTANRQVC